MGSPQRRLMGSRLASWLALLLSYLYSYWLPPKPTNGIQACLLIGCLTFISAFLLAPHKANWWNPGLPPDWLSYFHILILIGSPKSQLMESRLASWLALLLSYPHSYWLPHKANWWDPRLPPGWLSNFHIRILIGSPQSQLMSSRLASWLVDTFISVFLLAPPQSQLMISGLPPDWLLSYLHSYWLPQSQMMGSTLASSLALWLYIPVLIGRHRNKTFSYCTAIYLLFVTKSLTTSAILCLKVSIPGL